MMKEAALVAVAIVIAGFLIGGRYELAGGNGLATTVRLDRLTGTVCTLMDCTKLPNQ